MFVIIKQDFMTSCHPLVNNQESHKPSKEQPEHWGGRSNRFISLSHSLLYFVFLRIHTHSIQRNSKRQKTKTQNPMKIRFPLCHLTSQINVRSVTDRNVLSTKNKYHIQCLSIFKICNTGHVPI